MMRWFALAAAYLILTLALNAPLLAQFSSAFPHDQGDPLLNTWLLWWSTQHAPLTAGWWNAAMFHPAPDVMALSELLIGLLPLTAAVQWLTGSPVVAYNVAYIASFPLCGVSAAMLAYEVTGGRRGPAIIAGVAFAFAPYRMGQVSHLQMLAYYGAPLALAALHRYLRTSERRWLTLFAAAWLLQALSNGYALFHVAVLLALWVGWFVRTRRQVLDVGVAWALASLPLIPLLVKYWQVHARWHLSRDINEIKRFGVDLADFASAPPELVVWGSRLWTARPETAVFPGATVLLVLGVWAVIEWRGRRVWTVSGLERTLTYVSLVAGLVALSALTIGPWRIGALSVTDFHKPFSIAVYSRILSWLCGGAVRDAWIRRSPAAFYVMALCAMYFLALGPEPRLLGRPLLYEPPYAWLMRLPGFASLRVPGRFAMLAVLCQAVLLACALARWRVPQANRLAVIVAAGLLLDGWATIPAAAVPFAGPEVVPEATAVVELPPGASDVDFAAIHHQMAHRRPLINGYSGYNPPHYLPFVGAFAGGAVDVLAQIDRGGLIEVAIDRGRGDAPALAAAVESVQGVRPLPTSDRWLRYLVPQRRSAAASVGPPLAIARVAASVAAPDAGRSHDGDIESGWSSGINQIGNEVMTIELETTHDVNAIVIEMGAFAFGYPRDLAIDAEQSDGSFVEIWRGPTAQAATVAALERDDRVPMTLSVPVVRTRRLRLRQLGTSPGVPWWIPEISVHQPVR